jgi:adenylate cyclase
VALQAGLLCALAGLAVLLAARSRRIAAAVASGPVPRVDPAEVPAETRAVDATLVVTDVRAFVAWGEGKEPGEVTDFLQEIRDTLADVVRAHHGTVDKFVGDGMLAVFGAPEPLPDHAAEALAAAREILARIRRIRDTEGNGVRIGVGVHSGEILVGWLGSGPDAELVVLGETVNIATRLEAKTKEYVVDLLVSAETVDRIEARDGGRVAGLVPLGGVPIRGRAEALQVLSPPPGTPTGAGL